MPDETPPKTPVDDTGTPPADPIIETVAKADHDKILADLATARNEAKALKDAEKKKAEDALIETKNWQKIAELREKERDEERDKNKALTHGVVQNAKFNSVKDAALKAGMRPEAIGDLGLLALTSVAVQQNAAGTIEVLGAERFVSDLKVTRPHWFGAKPVNLNGQIPTTTNSGPGGLVTTKELVKLSLEAEKSGDYTRYNEANARFLSQQTR